MNKALNFIKCWIRSYKIFIEDHQSFDNKEGYDGIDFDENTDLCCGDRVFLEMDVYKQHVCSEPRRYSTRMQICTMFRSKNKPCNLF